jgi:hypothetical protein
LQDKCSVDLNVVHNGHIFLQSLSHSLNVTTHPFDDVVIKGEPRWNYVFFFTFVIPNIVVTAVYAIYTCFQYDSSISKYDAQDFETSAEVIGLLSERHDARTESEVNSPDRVGRRRADSPVGFVQTSYENSLGTPIAQPISGRGTYHTEEYVGVHVI